MTSHDTASALRKCNAAGQRVSQDRNVTPLARPSSKRLDTTNSGRSCAEDGCETVLSRYNNTDRCGVHEPRRIAPATRKSK